MVGTPGHTQELPSAFNLFYTKNAGAGSLGVSFFEQPLIQLWLPTARRMAINVISPGKFLFRERTGLEPRLGPESDDC